ncbi:MAG: LysR family transcriptional regulator [Cryobacterium sp.]|nr:LysR family transcriptional regulator [Oligoflexia bacterium]
METIGKNLDALSAFHLTAWHGSFTQAGRELGLSKSMISKLVKRLEAHLGVQLFHRTTRAIGLTEEGKNLFSYSRRILALSEEGERAVKNLNQGDRGNVRISLPTGLGLVFFQSFLPKISQLLPEVTFISDLSVEVLDLLTDEVDFAIRAVKDHRPEVVAKYLGEVRDVICASPKFLKKREIRESPKSLESLPCILYAGEDPWNTWNFTSAKDASIQVEVRGSHATNSYLASVALCRQGLGIARLPYYVAAEAIASGELTELFPRYEISTHPLYLVHLFNEYTAKKNRVVKAEIVKWFNERPEYFTKARKGK